MGISSIPFATPDPTPQELLPCTEVRWEAGLIGFNQPLLIDSMGTDTHLGSYASTCQAAHLVGLVIKHRDCKYSFEDRQSRLLEANQLHCTLLALSSHLRGKCYHASDDTDSSFIVPWAFCSSARFILYELYACNEFHPKVTDIGIAEEVAMQQTSLDGINTVLEDVSHVSEHVLNVPTLYGDEAVSRLSPLLCHCIYLAVSECNWLCQEEKSEHRVAQLDILSKSLQVLARVWNVTSMYLNGILFFCSN